MAWEYWLTKALAKAEVGNRNTTAFWLACQIRDEGYTLELAAEVLKYYAANVEEASTYYIGEAIASVVSAYSRPKRSCALNIEKVLKSPPKGSP